MNEERKRLLIEALRSGEFKQTRGVLKDSEGHCCLGVACEVYLRNVGVGKWNEDYSFSCRKKCFSFVSAEYAAETGVLPYQVREWFGFTESNPRYGVDRVNDDGDVIRPTLASLNDRGSSFEEIALVIEEKF